MLNLKKFLGLEYYISGLDQFLIEYRIKHPRLSASQRLEKEKYAKIFAMRDFPKESYSEKTFWDKF